MKKSSELLLIMSIVKCLSFTCKDVKHVYNAENNCSLMKKLCNLLLNVSDLRNRFFRVQLKEFYREM